MGEYMGTVVTDNNNIKQIQTMDSLKGATLVKADGSQVKAEDALENKDLVLFYFSAHWCPPLQTVHPHAERLLRRGVRPAGDCVRVQRQVSQGHDRLHEGVSRRLVWSGA